MILVVYVAVGLSQSFLVLCFPFPSSSTCICVFVEFVLLLPPFSLFSIQSCRCLPFPTLTCEQRVEATEVTLVYLPTNLFAFHLRLLTENETLLF